MTQFRVASAALAVSIGIALLHAPAAFAQEPASAAAPMAAPAGASMTKQEMKAQRKAKHKAARAKRNADLNAIEKNGYRLSADKGTSNQPSAAPKAASSPAQ
ncbi:hypothetical protein [Burkholderia guangdongensis]|uniref:hypothetical protein n=1 Tax=Burkholderia guangdongensis TaxID=1792500 RepID=UPI0015CDF411|nr:hypothetical protein [Burkholderia guangdongensis]